MNFFAPQNIHQNYDFKPTACQTVKIDKVPSQKINFVKSLDNEKKPKKVKKDFTRRKQNHLLKHNEFIAMKFSGHYKYIQQQLCNTNFVNEKSSYGGNFSTKMFTPFGEVTVNFRCCKNNRYIRVVPCGKKASYDDIIDELHTFEDDFETIIKIIYEFLTYKPVSKFSDINEQYIEGFYKDKFPEHFSEYQKKYSNEWLARFCCIIAFCDSCYGLGETGGAEIRGILDPNKCNEELKRSKFKFFLDPKKYFFYKKGAYATARKSARTNELMDSNISDIFAKNLSGISILRTRYFNKGTKEKIQRFLKPNNKQEILAGINFSENIGSNSNNVLGDSFIMQIENEDNDQSAIYEVK